jgi:hypothetical protein
MLGMIVRLAHRWSRTNRPWLQPVHSQYTKRPLSALNHRYPSTTLLEQYQWFTRLSTITSDPDNDLIIRRSSVQARPAPLTNSIVTQRFSRNHSHPSCTISPPVRNESAAARDRPSIRSTTGFFTATPLRVPPPLGGDVRLRNGNGPGASERSQPVGTMNPLVGDGDLAAHAATTAEGLAAAWNTTTSAESSDGAGDQMAIHEQ